MSNIYYYEAGYLKRIAAYLIDCLLLFFPLLFCFHIDSNQNIFLTCFVLILLADRLYIILMNKFCNGTLGKKLFKLKIISVNCESLDQKLSWREVLIRQVVDLIYIVPQMTIPTLSVIIINDWKGYETFSYALDAYRTSPLGKLILSLSVIFTIADIITMLKNDENRSLHDLMAETVVIEK